MKSLANRNYIYSVCIALIINVSIATAQSVVIPADKAAKAKAILDKISANTKKYKSLFSNFTFTVENKDKKVNEKHEGSLWVKGDKYKLEITGQTIISDGKTTWTYLKDANEIQINNTATKENEDKITPNNIFTLFEKGFKYEYVKEETTNKIATQIINLYPLEPKKKGYHTAQLVIDKVKQQILSVKINGKDGNTSTYTVKKFTPDIAIADDAFTYNKNKYPGAEVVDLRD